MKIHLCEQKSIAWHNARRGVFTASEFDAWCIDPCPVSLTVDQIKALLTEKEIAFKGNAKRDDLLKLLPDADSYRSLTKGARTAIIKNINSAKEKDAWQVEQENREEIQVERNIPVQRGNALEPKAREFYQQHTGRKVYQLGFITHDEGGFGCSPDGLIRQEDRPYARIQWGLEIKCPMPDKHVEYLLDGTLPDDYRFQVHGSMAVTGVRRWDFLSYCPGEAPLLLTVEWSEFTEQMLTGLRLVVAEKAKMKARLSQMWKDAFAPNRLTPPPTN